MMSKIRNYAQSAKGRVVMLLGTLAMVAVATFVVAAIPAHARTAVWRLRSADAGPTLQVARKPPSTISAN